MRFIIENFGPIEEADIILRDLNIFIGKNSAGKSYLAYLIWALLSVEPNWEKLRNLFDEFIPNDLIRKAISRDREIHGKFQGKMDDFDFKKYVDELYEINEELSRRFKSLIIEVFKRFDDIWGRSLENLLKDTFLIDNLGELVRTGCDKAKIIICDDKCKNRITVEFDENGLQSYVDEEVFKTLEENIYVTVVSGEPMFLTLYYFENSKEYTQDFFFSENYQSIGIIPTLFMWFFDDYAPYTTTFIAPDGRTGLIRSMEAYNYALMSGRVTINEVDRRFMQDCMSMYPKIKNEEICKIADFLEEKLGIKYILRREQPRFVIRVREIEMPLQRAPSGYRELAPLIYATRYLLDKDHVVFVEEPEAHLHPDAQVIVTRALAGLSKHCYVVITTHSITVLDEISNLLKLSKVSDKSRFGYEEWEGLRPENVGIFLFSDGNVQELEVDEEGIEESDLDRVVMEIANLHARVEAEYERSRRLQAQR